MARAQGPSAEPAWEVFAQLAPPPRASNLSASGLALPLPAEVLLPTAVECKPPISQLHFLLPLPCSVLAKELVYLVTQLSCCSLSLP